MYCGVSRQDDKGSNVGKTFILECSNFHLSVSSRGSQRDCCTQGCVDMKRPAQTVNVRHSEAGKALLKLKAAYYEHLSFYFLNTHATATKKTGLSDYR